MRYFWLLYKKVKMLNNLEILNGSLSPSFNPNIYEYEVVVDDTTISLDMKYDFDEEATLTVYGNDLLAFGENHVLIEVYQNELKTYTLKVIKTKAQEAFAEAPDMTMPSPKAYQVPPVVSFGFVGVICISLIIALFCVIFKRR